MPFRFKPKLSAEGHFIVGSFYITSCFYKEEWCYVTASKYPGYTQELFCLKRNTLPY